MRLFLALGSGDIVGARRAELAGKAVPETSIAFSGQMFAFCRSQRIQALAISSNTRCDVLRDGSIQIENRPKPLIGGGLKYHLSMLSYAFYLASRARRFGADVAVIDSGTTHYFALTIFSLLRIPVFVNLHNVLWPRDFPPRVTIPRVVRYLNALYFRHLAYGAMGVSPECERQVRSEAGYMIPFQQYRCQFSPEGFKRSEPYVDGIFRIAFVGRAEKSKGVLDIVAIAKRLLVISSAKIAFEICGDGGALSELRKLVEQEELGDCIIIRGRLERSALLDVYARAHAVIVPTRSDFCEGMPQSCAEAVMAGVPVVTSKVSNAFDVIGAATVRAETNDVESYVQALLSLITNGQLRNQLREACAALSRQFLDYEQSYPAALNRLLCSLNLVPIAGSGSESGRIPSLH